MSQTQESRPDSESKAAVELDPSTLVHIQDIFPAHAGLVSGVYVAVVQVRGTDLAPRYRRRVYWNLPAANRAIARATMAGLDASIILCQLMPAGGDK